MPNQPPPAFRLISIDPDSFPVVIGNSRALWQNNAIVAFRAGTNPPTEVVFRWTDTVTGVTHWIAVSVLSCSARAGTVDEYDLMTVGPFLVPGIAPGLGTVTVRDLAQGIESGAATCRFP